MERLEPTCPRCKVDLLADVDNDGDTETMGGLTVEYLECPRCREKYQLIRDPLDGDRLY